MRELNASKLGDIQSFYLKKDFEFVMSKIYDCYLRMLDKYSKIENNENKIRNRLYKDFLSPVQVKELLGLNNWIFHPEVPEIDDDYHEHGRTDIMFYSSKEYIKDENAYYVIECKRLDGNKRLNDAYIENGINRFITEKYPIYKNVNGMLGFIVKPFDIPKISVDLKLDCINLIPNFEYAYTSSHTTKNSNKDFTLYHLMLDFSSIIKKEEKIRI